MIQLNSVIGIFTLELEILYYFLFKSFYGVISYGRGPWLSGADGVNSIVYRT